MTLVDLLLLLLVAGVCGALGQAIGGFSRGGCLVSIALGFIGALLGLRLASQRGAARTVPRPGWRSDFPRRLVNHWLDALRRRHRPYLALAPRLSQARV